MDQPTFAQPALDAPIWELSGWWRRVGAYLLDGLLIGVIAAIPLVIAYFATGVEFAFLENDQFEVPSDQHTAYGIFIVVALASIVLVPTLYYCITMSRTNGQTPGKQAVGIRVVREDGQPVGAWFAFLRQILVITLLFGVLGSLLYIAQLVDFLWPLWDRKNQALHDKIVKSRVVRAEPVGAGPPADVVAVSAQPAQPLFPQAPAQPPASVPPPPPPPPPAAGGTVPYSPPPGFDNPVPDEEK